MGQIRSVLHARLSARRGEIERVALERVRAFSDPAATDDPQYAEGLRVAVPAALGYGLDAIACSDDQTPQMPLVLITQARLAARCGVSLDIVLRRYFAGYSLFGDFLFEEAESSGIPGADLRQLLRKQATLLDRVLATVSEEHARELGDGAQTSERRRGDLLRRLLDGELVDASSLAYDFEAWHTGVVGDGRLTTESLYDVAASLNRRLLLARPDEHTVWAWFGGQRRLDPDGIDAIVASALPGNAVIAFGEEGRGLGGWRLTHRQAAAAKPVARASRRQVVHYADVALLASVAQDDVLAASLRLLYLEPLEREHGDGELAKETLRAYFEADRNISSAAAALGANRNTVASRLQAIERRIGRRLQTCASELEAALCLDRLWRAESSSAAFVNLPDLER